MRVVGAAHSHAPLVPTEGVVFDLAGLSGLVSVDPAAGTARVHAGTRMRSPELAALRTASTTSASLEREATRAGFACRRPDQFDHSAKVLAFPRGRALRRNPLAASSPRLCGWAAEFSQPRRDCQASARSGVAVGDRLMRSWPDAF